MKRIKAAAIKLRDGRIFTGRMHGDIVQSLPSKVTQKETIGSLHGFVTTDGEFVDRQEARDIAVAANQVPKDIGVLYSEDLMTFDSDYCGEEKDGEDN